MQKKDFTIKIDHPNKLIRYSHHGIASKEAIGEAWEAFLKIEEFLVGGYNLLSDYSATKFEFRSTNDIDEICNILEPLRHILEGKKQALIISHSIDTALSIMFEDDVLDRVGFIVKVFSTKEAALHWLMRE